jgi:hypothetical protein
MLGRKIQKNAYSNLGMKMNKRGSLIGHKIQPMNALKSSLISYNNNENKKSYLEK